MALVSEVPAFRSAYELRQCIGQGASSTVWTAYCKTLGQIVAVKVIDMEGVSSTFEEIRVRREPAAHEGGEWCC